MDSDKQFPKQLIPYMFKKGQSGNPAGRPKGKTLKEFAREYLESLPDDEKIDYLSSLPTALVWQMAEGNPETKTQVKIDKTTFSEEELELAKQIIVQRISNRTTETSSGEIKAD